MLPQGGQIEASGLGILRRQTRHERDIAALHGGEESRVIIIGGGVVALHGGKERRMMIGAWHSPLLAERRAPNPSSDTVVSMLGDGSRNLKTTHTFTHTPGQNTGDGSVHFGLIRVGHKRISLPWAHAHASQSITTRGEPIKK